MKKFHMQEVDGIGWLVQDSFGVKDVLFALFGISVFAGAMLMLALQIFK